MTGEVAEDLEEACLPFGVPLRIPAGSSILRVRRYRDDQSVVQQQISHKSPWFKMVNDRITTPQAARHARRMVDRTRFCQATARRSPKRAAVTTVAPSSICENPREVL